MPYPFETPPATLVLTIPGLGNSGPDHWQTRWEAQRPDCRRVELGMWDAPYRNTWVNQLNLAIHCARAPVVLAAHSLGCLTVAWWANYEPPPGDRAKPAGLRMGLRLRPSPFRPSHPRNPGSQPA